MQNYLVIDNGLSATVGRNIYLSGGNLVIGAGAASTESNNPTGWINGNVITTAAYSTALFSPVMPYLAIRQSVQRIAYAAGTAQVWTLTPPNTASADFSVTLSQTVSGNGAQEFFVNYTSNATTSVNAIIADLVPVLQAVSKGGQFTVAYVGSVGSYTALTITANAGYEILGLPGYGAGWGAGVVNTTAGVPRKGLGSDLTLQYGIVCSPTLHYSHWQFAYSPMGLSSSWKAQGDNIIYFDLFVNEAATNFATTGFVTPLTDVLLGGTFTSATTANPADISK